MVGGGCGGGGGVVMVVVVVVVIVGRLVKTKTGEGKVGGIRRESSVGSWCRLVETDNKKKPTGDVLEADLVEAL